MFSERRVPVPVPDKNKKIPAKDSVNVEEVKRVEGARFDLLPDPEQRRLLGEAVEKLVERAFTLQREELRGTRGCAVVFLDKSARPISTVFQEMWLRKFPEQRMPPRLFMNIGRETDRVLSAHSKKDLVADIRKKYPQISKLPDRSRILIVDEIMHTGGTRDRVNKIFSTVFPAIKPEYYALTRQDDSGVLQGRNRPTALFTLPDSDKKIAPWGAVLTHDKVPGLTGVVEPEEPSIVAARSRKTTTRSEPLYRDSLSTRHKERLENGALEIFDTIKQLEKMTLNEMLQVGVNSVKGGVDPQVVTRIEEYLGARWYRGFRDDLKSFADAFDEYLAIYEKRAPSADVFSDRGVIKFVDRMERVDEMFEGLRFNVGFLRQIAHLMPDVFADSQQEGVAVLEGMRGGLSRYMSIIESALHDTRVSLPVKAIAREEVAAASHYFAVKLRDELKELVREYFKDHPSVKH